jgi:hypothetical protein
MVRPFAEMLSNLQRGVVADEAATMLAKVTQAVQETGKKGTVTLKITVSPWKGNADIVNVTGEVDGRVPKPDPAASVFYPDTDGNLSRSDPNALALFPERDVPEVTR